MALAAIAFIAVFGFALLHHIRPGAAAVPPPGAVTPIKAEAPIGASTSSFACGSPEVIDGDTLRCGDDRIRLASIDAPEMPGHCRRGRDCVSGDPFASKTNLERMIASQAVNCVQTDLDHYDRIVALCSVDGQDLSCAQVSGGFAVNRYGALICPAP